MRGDEESTKAAIGLAIEDCKNAGLLREFWENMSQEDLNIFIDGEFYSGARLAEGGFAGVDSDGNIVVAKYGSYESFYCRIYLDPSLNISAQTYFVMDWSAPLIDGETGAYINIHFNFEGNPDWSVLTRWVEHGESRFNFVDDFHPEDWPDWPPAAIGATSGRLMRFGISIDDAQAIDFEANPPPALTISAIWFEGEEVDNGGEDVGGCACDACNAACDCDEANTCGCDVDVNDCDCGATGEDALTLTVFANGVFTAGGVREGTTVSDNNIVAETFDWGFYASVWVWPHLDVSDLSYFVMEWNSTATTSGTRWVGITFTGPSGDPYYTLGDSLSPGRISVPIGALPANISQNIDRINISSNYPTPADVDSDTLTISTMGFR